MRTFKTLTEIIGTWITICGAIAGGVFAIVEYRDNVAQEKVKATLEYVTRFNSKPLYDTYVSLGEFWDDRDQETTEKQRIGEAQLKEYILTTIRGNKLQKRTDQVLDFFDNLRICVCAKVCDDVTAAEFFGKRAYELYGIDFPYIEQARSKYEDPSFGIGLESFAHAFRHQKPIVEVAACNPAP